MKYRKIPAVIDAMEWTGDASALPAFALSIHSPNNKTALIYNKITGALIVRTLEGDMTATIGDFLIRGVEGELYFCKPEIFKKTYERVEEGCSHTTNGEYCKACSRF